MALKVMNKILGKSGPKKSSGAKIRREDKAQVKEEEKMNRAVAISQHQRKENGQTVVTSAGAIRDAVFSPKPNSHRGPTPVVALDCEMVGVEGNLDALARVSIVNYNGHVLMDKFVRPEKRIVDFRSWVSGVHPFHLKEENGAIPFKEAQSQAIRLLKDKLIVGHSLNHDFKVLDYEPDDCKVRDFTRFTKYKNQFGQIKSLKNLTLDLLGKKIQQGEHSSVIDAQASIGLYRLYEKEWENHIKQKVYSDARKCAEQDV